MKKVTIYAILAAVLSITASSCTKESMSYLNLSVNSYTFGFAGDDTLEVTVSSSESDWTATPGNNLVSVEKTGKDVAVITMLPNETSEYVTSEVVFKAGGIEKKLYIDQRPKSYRGISKDFQIYTRGAMSRNGKWIAYMTNEHEAWLIDTETGEETALEEPPYPGSSSSHYNGLRCISDDARYIVFDHDGNAITTMTIDGEVHEIKVPDGYKHGNVESMSADGSIWVGHVMKEGAVGYWPCRWINGEPEILDRPEYQIDGVTPTFAGCLARGCSDDGSVIYGSEWDAMLLVYWKNGKLFNIGEETGEIIPGENYAAINGLTMYATNTNVSPDGKYIATEYKMRKGSTTMPAIVNTQTGQYQTLSSEQNCISTTVGPDGTVFGTLSAMQGYVFDFENGTSIALEDWVQHEYGITIGSGRTVNNISNDGKVLFGYRMQSSGGFQPQYPIWYMRVK